MTAGTNPSSSWGSPGPPGPRLLRGTPPPPCRGPRSPRSPQAGGPDSGRPPRPWQALLAGGVGGWPSQGGGRPGSQQGCPSKLAGAWSPSGVTRLPSLPRPPPCPSGHPGVAPSAGDGCTGRLQLTQHKWVISRFPRWGPRVGTRPLLSSQGCGPCVRAALLPAAPEAVKVVVEARGVRSPLSCGLRAEDRWGLPEAATDSATWLLWAAHNSAVCFFQAAGGVSGSSPSTKAPWVGQAPPGVCTPGQDLGVPESPQWGEDSPEEGRDRGRGRPPRKKRRPGMLVPLSLVASEPVSAPPPTLGSQPRGEVGCQNGFPEMQR